MSRSAWQVGTTRSPKLWELGAGPGQYLAVGDLCDATDADLIAASLADPTQFAPIFDRHATVVHRYIASRVDSQAADDLVSEVFVIAFRRRRSFDGAYRDARPWLLGIATNAIRHHRRAEGRRQKMVARVRRSGHDPQESGFERMEDDADAHDSLRVTRAALLRIDQKYVEALMLFAAFDLSYEDIAALLGIRIGTVRSRISRGRAQLRELLVSAGQYAGEHDSGRVRGNEVEEEHQR